MEGVDRLLSTLEKTAEVKAAVAWAETEDRRVAAENQRKQAEAKRAAEENAEKRRSVMAQINQLRSSRKSPTFGVWYSQKFGALLKREPPFNLPFLLKIPSPLYYAIATFLLWGPLPFGLCYGIVWIPIWYAKSKTAIENALNQDIDRQIKTLERELAGLT